METVESDEEYEGGTVAIEHHAPNKRASRKLDELFELGNTATKEIEKNEETEALSSDGESPQPRVGFHCIVGHAKFQYYL